MQTIILLAAIGLLLCLDLAAIYLAIKSDLHERRQKLYQCVLVCLLPFIGAVLVILVSRDAQKKVPRVYQSGLGPNADGCIGGGMEGMHDGGGDY